MNIKPYLYVKRNSSSYIWDTILGPYRAVVASVLERGTADQELYISSVGMPRVVCGQEYAFVDRPLGGLRARVRIHWSMYPDGTDYTQKSKGLN